MFAFARRSDHAPLSACMSLTVSTAVAARSRVGAHLLDLEPLGAHNGH